MSACLLPDGMQMLIVTISACSKEHSGVGCSLEQADVGNPGSCKQGCTRGQHPLQCVDPCRPSLPALSLYPLLHVLSEAIRPLAALNALAVMTINHILLLMDCLQVVTPSSHQMKLVKGK